MILMPAYEKIQIIEEYYEANLLPNCLLQQVKSLIKYECYESYKF